jgi:hypothetical protein
MDAYRLTRGANLLAKGAEGISAGVQTAQQAAATAKGAQLAFQGVPYAMPTAASTAGQTGSALGAGLKGFASSGAGIGTIASLAGMGISALSDDDDPTKSNFGEYTGSVLSSAGTGAAIGSFFPGPGTAIGAGVGALYGYGKQLIGTRKAQQAEQRYESESAARRNEAVYDLNERIGGLYGSQLSNIAAGNLAQKTISGQNLGRNVMYQSGGPRNTYNLGGTLKNLGTFMGGAGSFIPQIGRGLSALPGAGLGWMGSIAARGKTEDPSMYGGMGAGLVGTSMLGLPEDAPQPILDNQGNPTGSNVGGGGYRGGGFMRGMPRYGY